MAEKLTLPPVLIAKAVVAWQDNGLLTALLIVMITPPEVPTCPRESRALAVKVWLPLEKEVVSQKTV